MDTATITIRADLLPLVRRLADDARVWADRLHFDHGGLQSDTSRKIAAEASTRAAGCFEIVRACDAAALQTEMAL
jgi:hypothetical protein